MIVKNKNQQLLTPKKKQNLEKLENKQRETVFYKKTIKEYTGFDGYLREKYNKNKHKINKVKKLEKEYENKDFEDNFFEKSVQYQHEYYKDNMNYITKELNKRIKTDKIEVYYVDKKKKI